MTDNKENGLLNGRIRTHNGGHQIKQSDSGQDVSAQEKSVVLIVVWTELESCRLVSSSARNVLSLSIHLRAHHRDVKCIE